MRIAVVSDVHSNLVALEAVLRHAEVHGAIDGVWSLGDVVGYGPEPAGVIAELRRRGAVSVAGNHDLAACGAMGVEEFNPVAAEAALWTKDQLGTDEQSYLRNLPLVWSGDGMTLVHGSLRAPEWEYLLEAEQARAHFALQLTPYSLIGHSHLQFWCEETIDGPSFIRAAEGDCIELGNVRLIMNPGSVGQPRDGDPRAGYVLYDEGAATITWHRVEYDIVATQRRMREAGLPHWLVERLALGK
jgi:diadenosine tetraphosphatase ApaH/serine/threonine PP2A family protein phosphatase